MNNRFELALPMLDVSAEGLQVGQSLHEDQLEHLRQLADRGQWYRAAVQYLAVRRRSRREIMDYLRRKEADPEEIPAIVERLESSGLVDDLAFGKAWVADRLALRPRSRRQLEQELQAKGLSLATIATVLAEVAPETEDSALCQLISRKRRQYPDDERLIRYLQRQGYSYDQIKQVLHGLSE
ncbi:MAG TPA: regulatory protein RecX [Candidatus Saccharimonadia bacterium]